MAVRAWRLTRLCVVVAALAAVCTTAPAQAVENELVVEGDRSSFVDFTLTEQMTITRPTEPRIQGRSAYVALVIERLGDSRPPTRYAVIYAPGIQPGYRPVSLQGALSPGAYRLRLITTGPARVILDVDKGGRLFRPSRRLSVQARSGAAVLTGGLSSPRVTLPRAVPIGYAAMFSYATSVDAHGGAYGCVTTKPACQTLPFAPPSPVPSLYAGQPAGVGSSGAGFTEADGGATRSALFGVENAVSAEAGALRALVLAYRP